MSHVLDLQAIEVPYQAQATEYEPSIISLQVNLCDPPASYLSIILCAYQK